MRTLRSKEAAASVNIKTWPTIIDTGMSAKKTTILSHSGFVDVPEFALKQEVIKLPQTSELSILLI